MRWLGHGVHAKVIPKDGIKPLVQSARFRRRLGGAWSTHMRFPRGGAHWRALGIILLPEGIPLPRSPPAARSRGLAAGRCILGRSASPRRLCLASCLAVRGEGLASHVSPLLDACSLDNLRLGRMRRPFPAVNKVCLLVLRRCKCVLWRRADIPISGLLGRPPVRQTHRGFVRASWSTVCRLQATRWLIAGERLRPARVFARRSRALYLQRIGYRRLRKVMLRVVSVLWCIVHPRLLD
mmetsp:Transcript_2107/g.9232  ORF Transcript_2107/g.9232 Transcript_2107/m.9232 type:complete len:238 (+) Transcript_2107:856-1569(+)